MKFIFKQLAKPNTYALLVVLFFGLLASRYLFNYGYWNMHDDLQAMRQLEMEKCFLDGQFPCRWSPDMGFGFGYPLFNFYPQLPYLLGQIFRVIGFSFLDSVKAVFIFAFLASGVTMFYLAKELYGRKGGVLAAIFYIWAPYHSVDIYVRGAMNEAWALIWFPAILYFSLKLIKENKNLYKYVIGLALSWFALFTSHNLMVMIFSPFFAVWMGIFILKYRKLMRIPKLAFSGILAFGLASFFVLPVFLEKNIVQIETLVSGFFDYTAHFATIDQLFFSRFWGDGASLWGPVDAMPFPIGHFHWVLAIIITAYLAFRVFKSKSLKFITEHDAFLATAFFVGMGWFTAFMTHNKSTPLWMIFESQMEFVQFPWRFLTLTTLGFATIAGFVPFIFARFRKNKSKLFGTAFYKYEKAILVVLVVGLVAWNWEFFKTDTFGAVTDDSKFGGIPWALQQTAGIYDYLPKTAVMAPQSARGDLAEVITGAGIISNISEGTNWSEFDISVSEDALVRMNIIYFPNWVTLVNGQEQENFIPEEEKWGRFYIELPAGNYEIRNELQDTFVRKAGNYVSLLSWGGLIWFVWKKRKNKSSN